MEFDFDVRGIQSGQWVTFQNREGEKFGPHMDNCSRSYFISAWFNRCGLARVPNILVTHFSAALGWGILKDI